jgi:putative ABC transport system substrate-binding protein
MNRQLLWLVTALLLTSVYLVEAQLKGKPKVGVLTPAERQWEGTAFREALRNLGYIEGSNILIDVRSAEGKLERMPELAAALINADVDVILAVNTPSTRAAMEMTKAVPIVMAAVGDPVGLDLVSSLARPGGNVTGVSNMSGDLAGKRLELQGSRSGGKAHRRDDAS